MRKSILILCFVNVCIHYKAQTFSGGSGTSTDPYLISNKADLKALSETYYLLWDKYYKQTENIYFTSADFQSGGDFYNGGEGFARIGCSGCGGSFTGNYDGGNHIIDGLYINKPTVENVGLFGYITGTATIQNLGVTNADVTGKNQVGILAGGTNSILSTNVSITNCFTTGSVLGVVTSNANGNFVGGLIGFFWKGTVVRCFSNANIDGGYFVGGLVGEIDGTASLCYATGSVACSNDAGGGFVGVSAEGNFINCYSTGAVSGAATNLGGFLGDDWGTTSATACFWNTETSGLGISDGGSEVRGVNTFSMQSEGTFTTFSWNFNGVWVMDACGINNSYPILNWQLPTISSSSNNSLCASGPVNLSASTSLGSTLKWFESSSGGTELSTGATYTLTGSTITINNLSSSTTLYAEAQNGTCTSASRTAVNAYLYNCYSGGAGTSGDPFQISTKTDLKYLTQQSGHWSKYFIQTADINFVAADFESGGDFYDTGLGFSPIGDGTTGFSGEYNGNEKTVANLKINRPSLYHVGFIGNTTSTGKVSKLNVKNADITGNTAVAGIVGYNRGEVTQCSSSGTISGFNSVGGLVGRLAYSQSNLNNSYTVATVSASSNFAGGLIGFLDGGTTTNCYASGSVSSAGSAGGLIAGNEDMGPINSSFWNTDIYPTVNSYGTGKTTSELQTQSTFTDGSWDFSTIWKMDLGCTNNGMPIFQWQSTTAYPTVSSTTSDYSCGTGNVTLSASPSAGIINWFSASSGGTAITTGGEYTVSGNDLTISNLSASTTYYAEADNNGCISVSRQAVGASIYGNATPTNLSSSNVSLASVDLSWDHSGAENMQIQYRKLGNTSWQNVVVAYADNYNLVHFLGQFGAALDYQWRIRVSCDGVYGPYSAIQVFSTPCKAASNLSASNISLANATLSWTHPGGDNMLIEYRKLGNSLWQSTGEIAYASSYILTPALGNFTEAKDYEWRVRVKCGSEWGDYSTVSVFSTPCKAASGLSSSNISLTSVTFSWTHPGGDNMLIEYRKVGNTLWQTTGEIAYSTPYVLTPTLGNFAEATDYEWRVRVKCGADWGNYSAISTFSSPCKAPISLNATNVSTSDVTITYTHPGGDNMLIEYRKQGYSKWQTTGEITYSNNYLLVPDLGQFPASTTFEYRVRVQCGAMWGDYSSIETFSTPASGMKVQNSNYEYSGIKDKPASLLETYPNPNDGNFTISASQEGKYNITNELGQIIHTVEIKKENNYKATIVNFAKGVYFITPTVQTDIEVSKIIVQ